MCVTLQPGMAFRAADEPEVFACVSNLRWAILAWPLQPVDDSKYILDPHGKLSWKFVTKVDEFEAGGLEQSFLPGLGVSMSITEWMPALKLLLKQCSEMLVFRELEFLAKNVFNMTRTGSMTRHDLLKFLANQVGDQKFAEEVLESVSCRKKRKLEQTGFDQLAGIVLDAMDKDEAAEWKDIRDAMTKKEKNAVAMRWQQWQKEAGTDGFKVA